MGNQEVQQFEEQEIDLLEVFHVLWRRVWILILALVVGASAAGAWTHFLITPQYTATSIIYILSKSTSITSLADLQIGSQMAADFQIIATTREVLEPVRQQYDVSNVYGDYDAFVKNVEVTNPTNSHMLQIAVTHPDPNTAAQISNAIAEQLKMQIAEVMSTDTPSTVEHAVVPKSPSSPSLRRNCLMGGVIGFGIAAGLILLGYFMDDTIKDSDDVTKYLSLNTLAEIPFENMGTVNQKKSKSSQRRSATVSDRASTGGRRMAK